MWKNLLAVFALACSSLVAGSAEAQWSVTFTDSMPTGTAFNPNLHFTAVWIETSAGAHVKTLSVWGGSSDYVEDLTAWHAAHGTENIDAVTSATLTSYGARMATWNGTNAAGTAIANGNYRLRIETSHGDVTDPDLHTVNNVATFPFTYAGTPLSLNLGSMGGFSNVGLVYSAGGSTSSGCSAAPAASSAVFGLAFLALVLRRRRR